MLTKTENFTTRRICIVSKSHLEFSEDNMSNRHDYLKAPRSSDQDTANTELHGVSLSPSSKMLGFQR